MSPGCVNGNNLEMFTGKSVESCKAICDERNDCLGFEFGVGGGNGNYAAGDCQISGDCFKTINVVAGGSDNCVVRRAIH